VGPAERPAAPDFSVVDVGIDGGTVTALVRRVVEERETATGSGRAWPLPY
jgi:hypothetical protein